MLAKRRDRPRLLCGGQILHCLHAPCSPKNFSPAPARLRGRPHRLRTRLGALQRDHRGNGGLRGHRRRGLPHVPAARRAEIRGHPPGGTAYVYLNYGIHWLLNVLVKGRNGRLRADPRARTATRRAADAGTPLARRPGQTLLRARASSRRRWRSRRHFTGRTSVQRPGQSFHARPADVPRPGSWRTCASASRARRICRGGFWPRAAAT